jgi:hypothetical protein
MTQQPRPIHQPASRKGEEITRSSGREAGRYRSGSTGSGRPAEKASPRTSSGVVTKGQVDPQSPYLQPA